MHRERYGNSEGLIAQARLRKGLGLLFFFAPLTSSQREQDGHLQEKCQLVGDFGAKGGNEERVNTSWSEVL